MSEIFPDAYAVFLVVQLAILMVVYIILRFGTRLRALSALCFSVLVVAALTLLLLCLDAFFNVYSFVQSTDLQEYVAGTFVVAVPFLLILMVKFLTPFLKEITSGQKAASSERARILRMVEEGKITAEEGGDLLEAMGKSSALRGQDRFSRLDMAILCGVALVVMGFFLPWVHIRNSMYQAGHQAGALGWTVFVVALLSAVPVFVTPKNFLYKISILQLFLTLIGLLLVISTLLRAGGHLGVGIMVCACGFGIGLIASGAKFKRLAA